MLRLQFTSPISLSKLVWLWFGTIFIVLAAFFIFLYFEAREIENLLLKFFELEKVSPATAGISEKPKTIIVESELELQVSEESKIPLATPVPGSDFILPESPLFEVKEEALSPSARTIHLPILIYHHIDHLPPNASRARQILTVSPLMFEKQMEYLFEHNYHPITFEKFINHLKTGEKIPKRSLIITFDDGWKNQYKYAFPTLKKYNFPATFFVVVNYIGSSAFMNREELTELLDNGMEIGSHTMNHPNLRGLLKPDLKYEIQNSKIILERKLKRPINVFAYPYGAFDSKTIEVVKDSNYLIARACCVSEETDQNIENPYALRAIQVRDDLYLFKKMFPPTKE